MAREYKTTIPLCEVVLASKGDSKAIDAINLRMTTAKIPLAYKGCDEGGKAEFDCIRDGTVEVSKSMSGNFFRVEFIPKPRKKKQASANNAPSVSTIVDALKTCYHKDSRQWILIEELRIGSGYGTHSERSIDLWALNTYPSQQNRSISYEIKRSRADFLIDLKHSYDKHKGARAYSDEFFYVAPASMLKKEEIPIWAGLIEMTATPAGLKPKRVSKGISEARMSPSWPFICSLLRRKDRILK